MTFLIVTKNYKNLINHYTKYKNFEIGKCFDVKRILEKNDFNKDTQMYAFVCWGNHWLFDQYPSSGLAHPFIVKKNIYEHKIFLKNVDKIFSDKLTFVITNKKYPFKRILHKYTNWSDEQINLFIEDFKIIEKIDSNIFIYKKINFED